MKKILTLLVMFALAACWTSCSDDDNDNENFGKNGKRLIREMHTEQCNDFLIKFDYDKDGYITKIENGYYKETYTISRQAQKVTYYYNGELSGMFTLNDKGYAISDDEWHSWNEEWLKEAYTYEYDNLGQMIKFVDYEAGEKIYTWKDGNIISEKYTDQEDFVEYEYYSEYENKSNIDLAQIFYLWEDAIEIADYCGKISKNLLKSRTDNDWKRYEYEYEFDEKGYVSTIKEYSIENGKKELVQLYHITYVE